MTPIARNGGELNPRATADLAVHVWRANQLRRLGVPRDLAERFADLVDWHAIADLVRRGCPARLALDIVH
jgi:hypothetical protein